MDTQLDEELGETAGGDVAGLVDVGEPAVVGRGTGVLELAEHVAHYKLV